MDSTYINEFLKLLKVLLSVQEQLQMKSKNKVLLYDKLMKQKLNECQTN